MKTNRLQPFLTGVFYMAAFALFMAPSAPLADAVPTVGGCAYADMYDPPEEPDCDRDGVPDSMDECPCDGSNRCNSGFTCDDAQAAATAMGTIGTIAGGLGMAAMALPGGQGAGAAMALFAIGLGVGVFILGQVYSDCY